MGFAMMFPYLIFVGYAVLLVLVSQVLIELKLWLRAKRRMLERGGPPSQL